GPIPHGRGSEILSRARQQAVCWGYSKFVGVLCLLSMLAICAACSKPKPPQQAARLAVLRCENLSGDTSIDWMGRAFADILTTQLTVPNNQVVATGTLRAIGASLGARPLAVPGISAERDAALAAGANRLLACEYSTVNGNLRVSAQVQDVASLKI